MSDAIRWRTEIRAGDDAALMALVSETGVFSADEIVIAGELVAERPARGDDSGYHFVIAERDGAIAGYACFGPIPGTEGSFDLYWIAVHPARQGAGLARAILARAEAEAVALGALRMFIDTSATAPYAPARALYVACGYAQVALLPDFYRPGDAKAIFAKTLG
jgi:GNAT superfamily N-acetyltransferase